MHSQYDLDHPSVAVIGLAGRFPGADNVAELWRVLDEGRETVRDYVDAELLRAGADPEAVTRPDYVKRGAHLRDVDRFDAAFFGYTGREAELMDPQHRVFLEVCHEALEVAGHGPGTFDGAIGVYAGTRRGAYEKLLDRPEYDNVTDFFTRQGNEPDALATKVAYKLDCTGPALNVATYCSTSLVAVHLATQQLLDGECDLALAGGVSIRFPQHVGYLHQQGGTLARDGRCRSFDAAGSGLIFGDGAAIVVLRVLEDALRDGDTVLAVIRGSAVNNDGARRAGYTAPGVSGQARVVREAIAAAGVKPADISYVETHGAGTPLGDSVEVTALSQAFAGAESGGCGIGSVKSNVGHLDYAAGVTALIKTVLALRHRRLPASLHFEVPNPELNLIESPFHVVAEPREWEPVGGRRLAGVSALGIGGTNAHVVLEEAPESSAPPAPTGAGRHLVVLSTRTRAALEQATENLRRAVEDAPDLSPADIAFTLQRGRRAMRHRRFLVCADRGDLLRALREGGFEDGEAAPGTSAPEPAPPSTDLVALGRYWAGGGSVDWTSLYRDERRRRVPLPTHPMNRRRYWPTEDPRTTEPAEPAAPPTTSTVDNAGPVMTPQPMPTAVPAPATNEDDTMDPLLNELVAIVAARFKMDVDDLDIEVPFLEMGADSLLLLSILQPLEERFGRTLSMRQFFGEFQTLRELADYLRRNADPHRLPGATPVVTADTTTAAVPVPAVAAETHNGAVATETTTAARLEPLPRAASPEPVTGRVPEALVAAVTPAVSADAGALERLAMEQLRLMHRQLDLVGGVRRTLVAEPPTSHNGTTTHESAPAAPVNQAGQAPPDAPKVPLAPGKRKAASGPGETAARATYLADFIDRYSAKTRRSKDFARRFRTKIADSRSTIGFRMSTKELLYPIVAERGRGARLWDLDDNEYVDLTMGFGVHLFGHHHAPIVEAIRARMDTGFGLGPRTELTEEVAEGILKLTGMDRLAFVNTGSEAVMNAVRLARAATKRDRIVIFSTGYHGHSDGVLAAPTWINGELSTKPIATGVSQRAVEDVYVLEFGTEEALEFIDRHGHELAAVMTEPVTTRHPGVQAPEFLRRLRELTHKHGAKLIFDEMVTGFRSHPGGIQARFGIEADIATYGKIIGGGLPLGVIAGRDGVMDAIDGGVWHFGDQSYPTVESTFFGGTFCQHPLSMVAAKAVLDEFAGQGPSLHADLEARTERFTDALNTDFRELEIPMKVDRFASLFRFEHDANMDLFFHNLLEKGVYIWEWRCCFLSTAHTDADLQHVRGAIRDSVNELRDHGLLAPTAKATAAIAPPMAAAPPTVPAAHVDEAGTLPANRAQRQLWALANIEQGGSLAYNLYANFWVDGEIDGRALRAAVRALVSRHESLRTVPSPDGELLLIHASADMPFDRVFTERDVTAAELDSVLRSEAARPFDLVEGPLFRVVLMRVEPDRHLLHLAVHHLVADGWSTLPMLADLATLYNGFAEGTPVEPPPVAQYRDFLSWQEEQAASPRNAEHRAYWRRLLADAPELDLPRVERPAVSGYRGTRRSTRIDGELFDRLRKAASTNGVTVFAFLVSTWGALLHRLTGQDDVVVMVPSSGRPPHLENIVGYCTNLLPLRLRLDDSGEVNRYLRATQDQLLDAMEHESHPFSELVADLDAENPGISRRLFQTSIALDRRVAPPRLHGATLTEADAMPIQYTPYTVDVNILDLGDGYWCDFDIDSDEIGSSLIEALPGYFLNLLERMVDGDVSLRTARYLPARQRAELIQRGRGGRIDNGERTVGELIEDVTAATPDRIAVQCQDRSLTYRELDEEANRLAGQLHAELGIGPESVVGIRMPRSELFLVTILAVWKCGACYVPLEPSHPIGRHLTILERCAAVAVVTDSDAPPPHADPRGIPWLGYAALRERARARGPQAPDLPRPLDAAAYLMFSSGSTGEPKGIILRQREMLNHMLAKREDFELDENTVLAQNAPSSFDISVWQFATALIAGGRVRVYPDEVVKDPALLVAELDEHGVTVLELVPSYLGMMLDELELSGHAGRFGSMRYVILQAEPLKPALVRRWFELFPDIPMSNSYGATETADDVLHHTFTQPPSTPLIPTGRPIRNASVYIVDGAFEPVPPGVRGELVVGGGAVARGYLSPEDAAAGAFLDHNPVERAEPGGLYRTGDMARWREDGLIDILGRNDHQVKVRGQRVELGEIERALHRLDTVADAVVRDFPGRDGGSQLVGYVIPAPGATVDTTTLKAELGVDLPDYMVPAFLTVLDRFPLNDNGKVDRGALPEPDHTTDIARPVTPARHRVDDVILEIAGDVLGREGIGVDDDFFDLGGNSIAAVRLVQRIRESFRIDLPVMAVFDSPRLADLGDTVLAATFDPLQPITPVGGREHYRASASVNRMFFLWMMDPTSRIYNIPMTYVVDGPVDRDRLRRAVDAVVARHDILRSTFDVREGEVVQRVLDRVEVEITDLGETEDSLERIVDGWVRPHNLRTGPPIRLGLAKRPGREEWVLVFDLPHIVLDEGSAPVLFGDLATAYRGEDISAAELSYQDFAEWEHLYRASESFARDRRYWLDLMADPPAAPDFPRRPRPPILNLSGRRNIFRLDAELTTAVRRYCGRHRVTPYMVLLAVFKVLLSKYSGVRDLVVGTPVDGRYHPATARIIGMFGNSLPLRTAPTDDKPFADYVTEIRRTVMEGLQHQAYPFEELVKELGVARDPSHNPLFDFMFVFTDMEDYAFDMDGSVGTPTPVSIGVAKMDLALSAYERDDTIEMIQEYATEIFDQDTIEAMGTHYTNLLRQAMADPTVVIADLALLSETERAELMVLSSGPDTVTGREPGHDLPLHELIEAVVDRAGERIAVVSGETRLTYRELDERANQLARVLREDLGVAPGEPVGLLCEHGYDMVVSMLAVLKAGGAYLPFERTSPPARLAELITTCGMRVVVSDVLTPDNLPADVEPLAPDEGSRRGHPTRRLAGVTGPDDLAYIMFTSGSTGVPKGVLVEHASVRRVTLAPGYVRIDDGDVVLQSTSWAFDGATFNIYAALLNGGTLVCPDQDTLLDPNALRRLVIEQRVSVAFLPTAFFHTLVDGALDCLEPIRTIVVGGERLSAAHARRALAVLGPDRLVNGYGPTETTVFATAHRVDEVPADATSVPIGTPVDQTRVHLLLPHGRLAPVGIAGELCVGGPGVARGYLGLADDPDSPFVPNPFVPGERMYRTGDLARWSPDGTIEFMGRVDHQVKIRGHRVEPAEIEAAIRRCPGVVDVCVLARPTGADQELRLISYLVTERADVLDTIGGQLTRLLPDHLLPDHHIALDRLPLNANGKIDREALPPVTGREVASIGGAPGGTPTQKRMLRLWQEVLGVTELSTTDSFFDLGGHSLRAVLLTARVRDEFGVEVPLKHFFAMPTVHGLSEQVDNLRWLAESGDTVSDGDREIVL